MQKRTNKLKISGKKMNDIKNPSATILLPPKLLIKHPIFLRALRPIYIGYPTTKIQWNLLYVVQQTK